MPTLLTRKVENSLVQSEPEPCDFNEPTQNVMVEQEVTTEELRARCARYQQLLASLQPSQENTMIRAANFTVESILQLIQQNPGSSFVRVYYGIEENGAHHLFMGPVKEEASFTSSVEDTLYVEECCLCPPRLNCPNDELLEWQP